MKTKQRNPKRFLKKQDLVKSGLLAAFAVFASAAQAQDDTSWWDGVNFSLGGFIRPEFAVSTTGENNWTNQRGNTFNGRSIARQAYVPPALIGTITQDVLGIPLPDTNTWTTLPVPALLASDANSPGVRGIDSSSNTGRPLRGVDNHFNYQILRGELELGVHLNNDLTLISRLRAIYDPGWYDDFNAHSLDDTRGGISGGLHSLYAGDTNYFAYQVEGDKHPNPLEWAGRNYQIYFPALFLEYNHGPLNIRLGNQQIAWGQAIFFRVLDIVDGLDLRRHSLLDYAQEEFSDKRVPALGLRVGYQINDEILADAYVQKFQPTVYGNPNTMYNVIPVQFTVHDMYHEGGYDDKFSYGLRLKGSYGQWGFQAVAAQRYNPDGVFRWTQSGVDKNLPDTPGSLGQLVNTTMALRGKTSGEVLAGTPFEASPGGVYSADEWFNYAAQVRLNGLEGLNASIDEFPDSQAIYASHADNYQQGVNELNTFFIAAGGSLRGHIARDYYKEEVYGLGASYVTEGAPGGILDQLIINLEASYTPDKKFTSTTLSQKPISEDSVLAALVLEKYYRFTEAFPATYFVLQYMYRNADDLFGRSLKGYGGTQTKMPDGVKNANYIVFAFQQPFPNDVYRIGFATLYDPRGSILVQPGIKWKPSGEWTVEGFYSYINGKLGHANPNDTLLSTVDYADEATIRITYQF
ncbi:MAG TPA: DUF1302 family protein [Solimonas sp.]|nr:DUF1302 family protein [Solimonas sp.]